MDKTDRNTKHETRSIILREVRVTSTQQYKKCLGLLALIGCSKVSTFNGIKGGI